MNSFVLGHTDQQVRELKHNKHEYHRFSYYTFYTHIKTDNIMVMQHQPSPRSSILLLLSGSRGGVYKWVICVISGPFP